MLPDHDAFCEIVRASLPPGAALDMAASIGTAGLDSLRMARIALMLEELLETELADSEVETLLTARNVGALVAGMEAISLARDPR